MTTRAASPAIRRSVPLGSGIRWVAVAVVLLYCCPAALGQLPATRLAGVYPAGVQAGQSVKVTISGGDLDDVDRLLFSHAGLSAARVMAEPGPFDKAPRPIPNRFQVTSAANVPAGVYEVRAAGKYGASNPRAFTVGELEETVETEPNNDIQAAGELTLPVAVNGRFEATGDVDYFQFTAPAGRRIVVMGCARQIDSPVDMVVTVYDAGGRQVGGSRDGLAGDSLVDFQTSRAGKYRVKVHDAGYRGGAGWNYRLRIGELPVIDYIFPPAAQAGGTRPLTIYGRNLPGGRPSGVSVGGRPLQKLAVNVPIPAAGQPLPYNTRLDPAAAALDATAYRIKGPHGFSNSIPIGVAASPVVLESSTNDAPAQSQAVDVPCEVMGQCYPQRDRDWFQFEAIAGRIYDVELISQRMGVRSHPSLLVQRVVKPAAGEEPEQTQQVAYVSETISTEGGPHFDLRSDDPTYRFTAPADGLYRLMVRDAYSDVDADPRRVYRLLITAGRADFRLAATAEGGHAAALLRRGGQLGVRVAAFRRGGFDGEILVAAGRLPTGVTASPVMIGPTAGHTMLVLTAAPNAKPGDALIEIVGTAKIDGRSVSRTARFGAALTPTAARQNSNQVPAAVESRIGHGLAVSVSAAEVSPILDFKAGGGQPIEHCRGAKIKIPVTRGGAFKGKINFMPRGLPANVSAPAGAINANAAAGEFQVDLRSNTPTGTFSFYLDAVAEQVDYARNPEAAAAAAERKKEVDAAKTKADADAKAAASAKTAADQAATAAAQLLQRATAAVDAAKQTLDTAAVEVKAAADRAAAAKTAAAAKDAEPTLTVAAKEAQTAASAAVAKAKTAADALTAAQQALTDAEAKLTTAQQTQATATAKAAAAADLAQQAAALKTKTDKAATDTAAAAKPKKINVPIISTPVTIKITPAPVRLAPPKAAAPLAQGQKMEVPLAITRLYGFKDQVRVQVVLPAGVSGVTIPAVAVAAGQTAGKLQVAAASTATAGVHQLTVRATMSLNGQNLTVDQPLQLTVREVKPAP